LLDGEDEILEVGSGEENCRGKADSISFWGRAITEDQAVVVAGSGEGGIEE